MVEKVKGIIISNKAGLSQELAAEVRPVADIVGRVGDHSTAFKIIKERQPRAVFLDLSQNLETGLDLVRRLTRSLPAASIFIVAQDKNPDLILEALRAGAADYIVFPNTNGEVLPIVRRALGKTGGRTGELVAVFSLKGGQGVTSLAINLADQINSLTGDRILLMDMNLYMGDVAICLNLPATYTSFNLIKDLGRIDHNLLFSSLAHHPNGFHVLTAPEEIRDADQISGDDVSRMLEPLRKYMDYVIMDLPHDFSERTLAALDAADTILLIAQQSLPVIKSVQRTLELFQELDYGEDRVKIVLNRHFKKSEFTPNDLATIFKQPIYSSISNDYRSVTQAVNKAKTLGAARRKSRINADFENLAAQLTGMISTTRKGKGWKKSLSSFLT